MACQCGHPDCALVPPRQVATSTFEVYQRDDDRWAWRLTAANGNIVATDGGQGYENQADCERIGKAVVVGLYAPRDLA